METPRPPMMGYNPQPLPSLDSIFNKILQAKVVMDENKRAQERFEREKVAQETQYGLQALQLGFDPRRLQDPSFAQTAQAPAIPGVSMQNDGTPGTFRDHSPDAEGLRGYLERMKQERGLKTRDSEAGIRKDEAQAKYWETQAGMGDGLPKGQMTAGEFYRLAGKPLPAGLMPDEILPPAKQMVLRQTLALGQSEEQNLRGGMKAESADFVKVRDAYNRVAASGKNPSPAGDLALIYNYMKILDPSSVVRESEFAQAASAGSYGDRIAAAVKKIQTGERLADDVRADFVDRARELYRAQELTQKRIEENYRGIAREKGISQTGVVVPRANPEEEIKTLRKGNQTRRAVYVGGKFSRWAE